MTTFKSLTEDEQDFVNYVMTFYGSKGLYKENKFKKSEVIKALEIRKVHPQTKDIELGYDSFDREMVRDIVLKLRDPNACVEHNFNVEGYLLSEKLTDELNQSESKSKRPKL